MPIGEPEKKGMSGCKIVAIVFGIITIVAIAAGIYLVTKIKDRVSLDPVKVSEMAGNIVQLDLGDQWEPKFSMDIIVFRMALYATAGEDGLFVLMDADSSTQGSGEQFETKMRAEFDKATSEQDAGSESTTQISSARQDFLVRGEPNSFLVVNSEGTDTKKKYLEVSGAFDSSDAGKTAFLLIKVPEEVMSLEQIKGLIESIR
jgi:hypothetical protein